jgi:hypothetical protein
MNETVTRSKSNVNENLTVKIVLRQVGSLWKLAKRCFCAKPTSYAGLDRAVFEDVFASTFLSRNMTGKPIKIKPVPITEAFRFPA